MPFDFSFPDSASHPEWDVPRSPDNWHLPVSAEVGVYMVEAQGAFGRAHEFLGRQIEAQALLQDQYHSVLGAFRRYAAFQNPPKDNFLWHSGYLAYRDENPLAGLFLSELQHLSQMEVTYPLPIKKIDRTMACSKTKTQAVQDYLQSLPLWHHVADYFGHHPNVKTVQAHLSRPGDRHHRQTFRDLPHEGKLLNLHVDPKPGVIKAIIYLGEVGTCHGPFQILPASKDMGESMFQRIVAWGNSTGNYCHTPEHRRAMGALPAPWRVNAIVGKLIPDDSEDFKNFTGPKGLRTITSDIANVIVFDPAWNFHRGGLVEEGERFNLQVTIQ